MSDADARRQEEWRLWIDTGGTFTDCFATDPAGELSRLKVLSSSRLRGRRRGGTGREVVLPLAVSGDDDLFRGYVVAEIGSSDGVRVTASHGELLTLERDLDAQELELVSPEEAPAFAARLLTRTRLGEHLPPSTLRLATTKGTNALLERAGDEVGLVVNRGFADLLEIGDQARPDLFALAIEKPKPFYRRVLEIDGRLDAQGGVLEALDEEAVVAGLQSLRSERVGALAVALLHSYRNPAHEERVGALARAAGFESISLSSVLAPSIKIVPRAQTAVVDAYLGQIVRGYLDSIAKSLQAGAGGTRVQVMTSAGGLSEHDHFTPKDSLLSGPAGGVVGAAGAAAAEGWRRLLTFDMGGTSTDVARYDGDYEYRFVQQVGDATIVAPALAIETVAAGGGSLCWQQDRALRVGPQSAGAQPGPACYGAGGGLAITDVNLLLGRIDPAQFEVPLDVSAARRAAELLRAELPGLALEEMLAGLLQIANERMADAMRKVSVRRGFDPQEYSMVSFGGAGGQHACGVAGVLGIVRVLVPKDASLLSAQGLGRARSERFAQRQILRPLSAVGDLDALFRELDEEAMTLLERDTRTGEPLEVRRRTVSLRFAGQDSSLEIAWPESVERLVADFEDRYRTVFGYLPGRRDLEVAAARVVASTLDPSPSGSAGGAPVSETPVAREVFFDGAWRAVPCVARNALTGSLAGPALITERHSVTVVEPGWSARTGRSGGLILERLSSDGDA